MDRPVCFLGVASHLGGAERSLLDLARGLRERGHYLPWVILPHEGALATELRRHRVEVDILRMPPVLLKMSRSAAVRALFSVPVALGPGALYFTRLNRLIRRRNPVLIHTGALKTHAIGLAVGSWTKTPVLWHLRDILGPGAPRALLKKMAQASPTQLTLVANSRATADDFGDQKILGQSVRIIHNGIRVEEFRGPRNHELHKALQVAPERPMVGIVGALAHWKGQREFLEAAQKLIHQGSNAVFAVIGGEIYDTPSEKGITAELKEQAKSLGISDRVLLTGNATDPARAIRGLDVLVHASIRPEPFGRVVIEAMACGVPVVAARSGGVLEIVTHEKTGLLVEPRDVDGIARAVGRILRDSSLRESLVREGLEVVERQFTVQRMVEAVERVYDEVTDW